MEIASNIDALIFDCDGTLADTMPVHFLGWQQTMAVRGHEFCENMFYELAGMPTDKILGVFNERHGTSYDPKEILKEKEGRFLQNIHHVEPIEVVTKIVREYLSQLPMAVASGGVREMVHKTIEAIGLQLDWFKTIVTAEDVTNHKPAPDTFLLAAKNLGVKPQNCLVFEDGDFGIEAAKAAGMPVIDIRPHVEA